MRSIERMSFMWDEALNALEQAERRHRRFCGLRGSQAAQPVWEPPADVFESGSEVLVCIALPGVEPGAVVVEVVPDGLVVRAERAPPAELASMHIHRMEIPYGYFERHVALARGTYSVRERRMAQGCLTLRLSKE